MRRRRIGSSIMAALAVGWVVGAAHAGESDPAFNLRELPGLPPAASGKPAPMLPPPGVVDQAPRGCVPYLPCGTRLLGTVRRNGAVELKVPAWRW